MQRQVGVAPNKIERYNRIRSATISGIRMGVTMGTAVSRVKEMLEAQMPAGFLYDWSGESRDLQDASEIGWVLVLALVFVYMVLASRFESLLHPLTVMLTVPLAAVGALGLLWLIGALGRVGMDAAGAGHERQFVQPNRHGIAGGSGHQKRHSAGRICQSATSSRPECERAMTQSVWCA